MGGGGREYPPVVHSRNDGVPLVELLYLVFTRMPGENYRRRLRSLLYLCDVIPALLAPLSAAAVAGASLK